MIDLIEGWASKFPAFVGVEAGGVPLFEDQRVVWALSLIGGVNGKEVLELGPLEGGHTYMLSRAGAANVTSIEANRNCFFKCLVTKEILGISNAQFLYGDFMSYLQATKKRFDVIWAAGVLYHMVEPTLMLKLTASHSDHVHIWTHYVPDAGYDKNADWAKPIMEVIERTIDGRVIPHYLRSYNDLPKTTMFCGGIYHHAAWLRRSDILEVLSQAGLSKIEVGYEDPVHPHGPAFALVASRP